MDSAKMKIYKQFLYDIRKMEVGCPYLLASREYPPIYLFGYVKSILSIPFLETSYNLYYGELRRIIYSFLGFYGICTDHAKKFGEDCKNDLNFDKMMDLFNATVQHQKRSYEEFLKEYQPMDSEEDQKIVDEIKTEYDTFYESLYTFGDYLQTFDNQEKVDAFAKDHFTMCLEKVYQMCDFTHIFIAKWLDEHSREIRISLEDILRRIQINYDEYQKGHQERLNELYLELYELNKEHVCMSRKEQIPKQAISANIRKIAAVKSKIQNFGNPYVSQRLEEELQHWTRRLAEFESVVKITNKIRTTLNNVKEEEKKHSENETIDLPGTDANACWHKIRENLEKYRKDLEQKYVEACRPLVTFFICRGFDRTVYEDSVGSYYIDDYSHQNYLTHYGAQFYHVNCAGEYLENSENEKYYFDEMGRYIYRDGKKLYQLAPCTSLHNLSESTSLYSPINTCKCTSASCQNLDSCNVPVRDLTDVVFLPKTEQVNIEKTLDAGTVKYLWESFGWILPELLNDVGNTRPKNPIHYLGHLLLSRSHSIQNKECKARTKEAIKYREEILKKRKKEAEERARLWKSKQVKPCKDCDFSYMTDAVKELKDSKQLKADLCMYYI